MFFKTAKRVLLIRNFNKIETFTFNNKEYKCLYIRSKRAKKLLIKIKKSDEEIVITYPYRSSLKEAEHFFKENIGWVEKKLRTIKPERILFKGKELEVKRISSNKNYIDAYLNNDAFIIEAPESIEINELEIYNQWLQKFAKTYLYNRTFELAEKYQFIVNNVTIRNQQTKWGSCSAKKNISLNYKMCKYDERFSDYIIIHELCHLKEMNHSSKFWNLVKSILPDYKEREKLCKI